jgi:hypothetical protein
MEYYIFLDESYISAERYRSISAFSMPKMYFDKMNDEFKELLDDSNVKEFKWQKLKDAKYRFCAIKLIKSLFEHIYSNNLRIDSIIWDTEDSRHKIKKRDDNANFERMFFHILKDSMKRRNKGDSWFIFPDEKSGVDWNTMEDCLFHVGRWRDYKNTLWGAFFSDPYFSIKQFEQVDSKQSPCCQIADLFAGLGVFSIKLYEKYKIWEKDNNPQLELFQTEQDLTYTKSEKERFEVLDKFIKLCKNKQLGVSIHAKKGLHTFNPNKPINFWHYQPQHENDKAPIKIG